MAKHYIRLDGIFITKGFSDSFIEPEQGDVCINENGQRHFEYKGRANPGVLDENGFSKYKYVDGKIVKATREEQPTYTAYTNEKQEFLAKQEERLNNTLVNLTFGQAEKYIDDNVTNIASAKTVLKKIVRLILSRT